ncbi:hypothetical protein BCR32DRAFT_292055 [Anaeromyces robustus]|uniref:DH domain-containing protein n=1 Tax=Anaeromyces robustus TaxID=1754192 RepID=A0A1Y1XC60_9FUNG|nr:hypothetical protein BCR32DRAFT_292055 [Anaeromyces robustus]|eukprot:ORX83315.1 hypothetical protein BCR32DRAFT_292055 [Anaeromyces robustus]
MASINKSSSDLYVSSVHGSLGKIKGANDNEIPGTISNSYTPRSKLSICSYNGETSSINLKSKIISETSLCRNSDSESIGALNESSDQGHLINESSSNFKESNEFEGSYFVSLKDEDDSEPVVKKNNNKNLCRSKTSFSINAISDEYNSLSKVLKSAKNSPPKQGMNSSLNLLDSVRSINTFQDEPSICSSNLSFLALNSTRNDLNNSSLYIPDIWNHHLTRLYFFMYLLSKGNTLSLIYLFRSEAEEFRTNFYLYNSSGRKNQATKIYNCYFVSSSPNYIEWKFSEELYSSCIEDLTYHIYKELDNPTPQIYDRYIYLSMVILEKAFYGELTEYQDRSTFPKSDDTKTEETGESFEKSVFYKELKNDIKGSLNITTSQFQRAIERILDLPFEYFDSFDFVEKIEGYISGFEIYNNEMINSKLLTEVKPSLSRMDKKNSVKMSMESINDKSSFSSQNQTTSTGSASSSIVETSKSKLKKIKTDTLPEEKSIISPLLKEQGIRKSITANINNLVDQLKFGHTFVQDTEKDAHFCEYCYKKLIFEKSDRSDDSLMAYKCEVCNMTCHKGCRNLIKVNCLEQSSTVLMDEYGEDALKSENINRIQMKMKAIQHELDIELKIRDGLEKLTKAKNSPLPSFIKSSKNHKNVQTNDVFGQIERSQKKLDSLKHEMTKYRLCLTKLLEESKMNKDDAPDSANKEDMSEGEVIKICCKNITNCTDLTKSFYATNETTTEMLIINAIEKFILDGTYKDYELTYTIDKDEKKIEDIKEPILQQNINFQEVLFNLKLKDNNHVKLKESKKPTENKNDLKQKEILEEICNLECYYLKCLNMIVKYFKEPLSQSKFLTSNDIDIIFSNIEDILDIHTELNQDIEEIKKKDDLEITSLCAQVINVYRTKISDFDEYYTYCANQANASRHLEKLLQNSNIEKKINECQENENLDKLTLKDLLIKPMHRITRYPLLFKRLLENIDKQQLQYSMIETLIMSIENKISTINEMVRKSEAKYRVSVIENSMDWNNIFPKFALDNDRRELISEKQFVYNKKGTHTVDITILVFTDMVIFLKCKKDKEQYILYRQPIPLENVLFLDKLDNGVSKNIIEIVHFHHDKYEFESISRYDKNVWLQEVEAVRTYFCNQLFFANVHYNFKPITNSTKYSKDDSDNYNNSGGGNKLRILSRQFSSSNDILGSSNVNSPESIKSNKSKGQSPTVSSAYSGSVKRNTWSLFNRSKSQETKLSGDSKKSKNLTRIRTKTEQVDDAITKRNYMISSGSNQQDFDYVIKAVLSPDPNSAVQESPVSFLSSNNENESINESPLINNSEEYTYDDEKTADIRNALEKMLMNNSSENLSNKEDRKDKKRRDEEDERGRRH